MTLGPRQKVAVERLGQDVCVVAGPGSGKTRVLVERFRWLVEEKGISPLRILAITFTEKAATEIKERLEEAFSRRPEFGPEIERAYVSTIHGFCTRILREYAIVAGLDPGFSVMDETESTAERDDIAHKALDQLFADQPAEMRRLLEAIAVATYPGGQQPDLAQSLNRIHEAMRVAGIRVADLRAGRKREGGPALLAEPLGVLEGLLSAAPLRTEAQQRRAANLRRWLDRAMKLVGSPVSNTHFQLLEDFECDLRGVRQGDAFGAGIKSFRDDWIPALSAAMAGEFFAPLHALLIEAIERLECAYRRRKRELGALDFSDLEEQALELLRSNDAVRSRLATSFDYILMDELQDTNRLQWSLLELVRRPDRFFAVGDINQSIYGFRHAEPRIFRAYRDAIASSRKDIDELYENHRSRGEILAAVNSILGGAAGIEPHQLLAERRCGPKSIPSVELIIASGATAEDAEPIEAAWVARRIRELEGALTIRDPDQPRPARFGDFAVLVRTANSLPAIERAFKEFAIPYLTVGGKEFLEGREVRDLTHLLRVIANPEDEVALAGVLRSPLGGVSDESLLRLKQAGSLAEGLAGVEQGMQSSAFDPEDLERLTRFRRELSWMRAKRDDVSPDRLLLGAIDASGYDAGLDSRARGNVDKLLATVRDWFERTTGPTADLVRYLRRLRESRSEPDAPPGNASDAVRLMSIHKAKGLQFPVVVIPALHRGTSNSQPTVRLSPEGTLGVRWRNPVTGKPLPDAAHSAAGLLGAEKEAEEGNRLLFVAMTRAQDHLILSYSNTKRIPSKWPGLVLAGLEVQPDQADGQPREYWLADGPSIRLLHAAAPPPPMEAPAPAAGALADVQVVSRPPVTDQYDSTATVTSVMTFGHCPRRYYLEHYIGWRDRQRIASPFLDDDDVEEPGFDEPAGAEFGLEVHSLLAGASMEGASPAAAEMVRRFEQSELGRRAARASRVEREFEFLMALDDVVMRGKIDLWFEEGGLLVLVDYKTDAVAPGEENDRADFYALQLRLYALALERLRRTAPDQAFLYLLKPDCAIPVDVSSPRLAETLEVVHRFREAQSELSFELREGEQCGRCPYFGGLCPSVYERVNQSRSTSSSREL